MLRIEEIKGRKALKQFVKFAIELYKGNDCYVPPIIEGEIDGLDAAKNPALDFCDSIYFMAYDETGKCVGRIAGFINPRYNEKANAKLCRFGYIDFIDDQNVSKALLDSVGEWGRGKGMETMAGPLGMCDMDYEGALTFGFDQLGTMSTIYNYPYYIDHYRAYGLEQDAVWSEFLIKMPEKIGEKHQRIAELVTERYGLKSFYVKSPKELSERYGHKVFELLNEAYAPLYCVSELDDKQIQYYLDTYIPLLPMDLIRLVTDKDDNLIAFGITAPSMSRAQQKAKGKLFPFGWYHLLKALKFKGGTDGWELMLIAVRPDYQGKGVTAIIFNDLIPIGIKHGFKWVSAYPELDYNTKVQNHWDYFDTTVNRKRATFACKIK